MEQLKLENQICFPVYAASRLITREYQPYMDELGITYPQYLVLLVLWENDGISVNEIAQKLILNTNTVTPLLKRMESLSLIERNRSHDDERKVIIKLTKKAKQMKSKAAEIPAKLAAGIYLPCLDMEHLVTLKEMLNTLINTMQEKEKEHQSRPLK
jgi:DNA-binding MarR family transcriptional regulator